ncbi:chalcone-flavanone isomerase-domain-containing protein [Phialemonium atrogriseum]|uniref:Chalcone-flavanone isomerase-domain-containing protein n=1 Tax=Phialemonium atrogriseum TaxID=1093897 RepID=A0AAJ0BRA3_9PEZI|nr:chalcone-flavanone isomerase-domain-containing protein [Phialemonium atrogriseum]KAK1761958.1 chalcone-flavanone isomerase-domain-containing protein [Phialemonium atrogriseum]
MFRRSALRQLSRPVTGTSRISRRAFLSPRSSSGRPVEHLNIRRLSQESEDFHRNRRIFLVCGSFAGLVSFLYTAWRLKEELSKRANKLDSGLPPTDPLASNDAASRKVVIHDEDGREIVPTGNSTVKEFPRTIELPSSYAPTTPQTAASAMSGDVSMPVHYTLVGLGVRTVTFIGLEVYVVGYYVATSDIAALQAALVKRVNPIATTLVPGERDELRTALLDPVQGEELWQELLQRGIPARSVFRVIPVRDTDFHHLRDGFVRSIQARSPKTTGPTADDSFGEAMRNFRGIFNRGGVAKKKELLLIRDGQGRLTIVYDPGRGPKGSGEAGGRELLGTVDDERISRALWLNYLAGSKVASEPARKNIVEGVMEFVERPVGTVASQVV